MTKSWQQLESSITRSLLKFLKKNWAGSFWTKIHGNPFQPRLIDIIGCVHGRFVAFEVKRPGADATPKQKMTLRELERAGALVSVVHSTQEAEKFLKKSLDGLPGNGYSESINIAREAKKGIQTMPRKSNTSTRAKGRQKQEEEEDLDDLADLDDLDDFDEDDLADDDEEDEEDEEEEEEKPARRASRATSSKAKTSSSKTASKTSSKSDTKAKGSAKTDTKAKTAGKGNASNLSPRRVTEGMAGVNDLAEELGTDARSVRVHLRKLEIAKSENGVYEWKPNGRDYKSVVSQLKKSMG